MYAITFDKMMVFMQPFLAGIETWDRPVVLYDEKAGFEILGKWERVLVRNEEVDESGNLPVDGKSGVQVFQEALEEQFGAGKGVRWGMEWTVPMGIDWKKCE